MFRLVRTSEFLKNYKADYNICFEDSYTLQEFIDDVLSKDNMMSGHIIIHKKNTPWFIEELIAATYQYCRCKKNENIPKEVYDYKIISGKARGSLYIMNYYLNLEAEV